MAITYPLSLPTSVGIERLRFTHVHSTAMLRSPWTYATQIQNHPGKMLAVDVTVAPCKWAQAAAWAAFIAKLKGPFGTFLIGNKLATTRGVATGTPTVFTTVASGSEIIYTTGWTPSTANILREGDYIQIGSRLYQVLKDVPSDINGRADLDVFPSVREALTAGQTIITSNPVGLFRLDSAEIPPYEVDKERLYTIGFTAVEAL
jgi:hypothetical protein